MTVGMIFPSGHPDKSGTCQRCCRYMEHIEATIDNVPYCHPHRGPDCYRIASSLIAIEQYSIPQRFMTGVPPVIPLHETPIYAAMVRLVDTADRLAKEHPQLPTLPPRKPLLKKGRKR